MKKYVKYIAVVETRGNGRVEQWSPKPDGHSLTSSGRWTDAKLHSTKKAAEKEAQEIAKGFNKKDKPNPSVRQCTIIIDECDSGFEKIVKSNSAKSKKANSRGKAVK
jgi:hypothetical protein